MISVKEDVLLQQEPQSLYEHHLKVACRILKLLDGLCRRRTRRTAAVIKFSDLSMQDRRAKVADALSAAWFGGEYVLKRGR